MTMSAYNRSVEGIRYVASGGSGAYVGYNNKPNANEVPETKLSVNSAQSASGDIEEL